MSCRHQSHIHWLIRGTGNLVKTLVILQARMSSRRLPGKVMAIVNQKPIIGWQIARIRGAKQVDKLVVATSDSASDNILVEYLMSIGVEVFRGPLDDVHARFAEVIEKNSEFESIVRLTGDCPFTMPKLLDQMILDFHQNSFDYFSNCNPPTYPDGLDIEVFSNEAFRRMSKLNLTSVEKEHVTLGFKSAKNGFTIGNKLNEINQSTLRWTLDYKEDLDFVRAIYSAFEGTETEFESDEILEFLRINPSNNNQITGTLRNVALTGNQGNRNE